jgi:hypothetical protein
MSKRVPGGPVQADDELMTMAAREMGVTEEEITMAAVHHFLTKSRDWQWKKLREAEKDRKEQAAFRSRDE